MTNEIRPGTVIPNCQLPDGSRGDLRIAEGRLYSNVCPDCEKENGGGVEREGCDAMKDDDPYSPLNRPCLWCGKGPMTVVFWNDMESEGDNR